MSTSRPRGSRRRIFDDGVVEVGVDLEQALRAGVERRAGEPLLGATGRLRRDGRAGEPCGQPLQANKLLGVVVFGAGRLHAVGREERIHVRDAGGIRVAPGGRPGLKRQPGERQEVGEWLHADMVEEAYCSVAATC